MVAEAKQRFPHLTLCSFDKGFHSPQNQIDLKAELSTVVLPKKGRLSVADKERSNSDNLLHYANLFLLPFHKMEIKVLKN